MADYMDAAKCLGGRVLDADPLAVDPRCADRVTTAARWQWQCSAEYTTTGG